MVGHPFQYGYHRIHSTACELGVAHLVIGYADAVLQVAPPSSKSLRLLLLHLVEHSSGIGHIVENLLHGSERYGLFGYELEHIARSDKFSPQVSELLCEQIYHRDTKFRNLAQLCTLQHACSLYLPIRKHDTAHVGTETRRYVRQPHHRIEQVVGLYLVCRKLLGVRNEVLDFKRRLDRSGLYLAEKLLGLLRVLNQRTERNPLQLELGCGFTYLLRKAHSGENCTVKAEPRYEPLYISVLLLILRIRGNELLPFLLKGLVRLILGLDGSLQS